MLCPKIWFVWGVYISLISFSSFFSFFTTSMYGGWRWGGIVLVSFSCSLLLDFLFLGDRMYVTSARGVFFTSCIVLDLSFASVADSLFRQRGILDYSTEAIIQRNTCSTFI